MKAVGLSKQQDSKAMQEINFIGNLGTNRNSAMKQK